ncbi:NlpC/P60 family protein [Cohnella pontilimi]|uniref:NlpC/P60 family protein n=1 Tax=Cohnella pontilimi TaxID=2564100 RepID=A0A4U0F924_9BACL|nr:C40 family peptidase [Cohnella pontilimi]TJY41070.1 NlpC/P60 family protein [Cohnella pontilimi]
MLQVKPLLRKVIGVSLFTAIGFTAMGFGHAPQADAATKADKIISTGKKYLGVKYRFGAPSGVTYAFDCSSFTQYIFKKNGVSLPRASYAQAAKGKKISKSQLKKGDLVFFSRPGKSGIGHVSVYAGNNKLLHAAGKYVKVSNLSSSYWKSHYITARRVI